MHIKIYQHVVVCNMIHIHTHHASTITIAVLELLPLRSHRFENSTLHCHCNYNICALCCLVAVHSWRDKHPAVAMQYPSLLSMIIRRHCTPSTAKAQLLACTAFLACIILVVYLFFFVSFAGQCALWRAWDLTTHCGKTRASQDPSKLYSQTRVQSALPTTLICRSKLLRPLQTLKQVAKQEMSTFVQ